MPSVFLVNKEDVYKTALFVKKISLN